MKFQEIVEKRKRNATSENGLTSYEKDLLIEAMYEKLRAFEILYHNNPDRGKHWDDAICEILEEE